MLEAVAWFEGELHSDHPPCVCPLIAHYCRILNDRLDERRQDLVPYIPRLANTRAGDGVFRARLGVLIRNYLAVGGSRRIAERVHERLSRRQIPAHASSFGLEVVCGAVVMGRSPNQAFALLDELLGLGPPSPGLSRDPAERARALEGLPTS